MSRAGEVEITGRVGTSQGKLALQKNKVTGYNFFAYYQHCDMLLYVADPEILERG